MNARTNIQIINGPDGNPAFVVIPYQDYIASRAQDGGLIPHAGVSSTIDGATPARAWREHLGLTQAQLAARLGISQSAHAQHARSVRLRKSRQYALAPA